MNVPNILSIFRITLVPVFILVFFSNLPNAYVIAACVYLLAGVTDVLDGFIARHFNLITGLGKILDPLADKLMTISVFICITIRGMIPWWLLILLFAKDLLLIMGGVKLYREVSGVFSANIFGKATTVVLVLGGVSLMIFGDSLSPAFRNIFYILALALSIFAFITYLLQFIKYKKSKDISQL